MIDIARQIAASHRSVGAAQVAGGEGHAVRIERTFDSPIDDVWDAVTNPERISRWFLPISGDLHVGGRYQLEGNAGGQILVCEPPHRYRVTWVYGPPDAPASELEVRLTASGTERTTVLLEHVAVVPQEMWDQFGPGAVGVGWDGGVLGLALHLEGDGASVGDPIAWQLSEEGRAFFRASSASWGEAFRASGASDEAVTQAVANTNGFYAPEPEAS